MYVPSESTVAAALTFFGFGLIMSAIASLIAVGPYGLLSKRARSVLVVLAVVLVMASAADMVLEDGFGPKLIRFAADFAFVGGIASTLLLDRWNSRQAPTSKVLLLRVGWSLLAAGLVFVGGSMAWAALG